ncbi:hypothetical protein H8959_014059 [Pygathrix nigripes]
MGEEPLDKKDTSSSEIGGQDGVVMGALKNQGFEIIERGEIKVKGKGKMTTYFLIQNLNATEDEIMRRSKTPLDHKEASAQGNQDRRTVMSYADSQQLIPDRDTADADGRENGKRKMNLKEIGVEMEEMEDPVKIQGFRLEKGDGGMSEA